MLLQQVDLLRQMIQLGRVRSQSRFGCLFFPFRLLESLYNAGHFHVGLGSCFFECDNVGRLVITHGFFQLGDSLSKLAVFLSCGFHLLLISHLLAFQLGFLLR